MLGFVGDSTLRVAVADVSCAEVKDVYMHVYCPESGDRKSVKVINIISF